MTTVPFPAKAGFLRSPAKAGAYRPTISDTEKWVPATAGKRKGALLQ
jgi:hypothetical protein